MNEDTLYELCLFCAGTGEQAMDETADCLQCGGLGLIEHRCGE